MLGSFVAGPFCLLLVGPVSAVAGVSTTLAGAGALLALASILPWLSPSVRRLPVKPVPAG
jgi:hypothetical protein